MANISLHASILTPSSSPPGAQPDSEYSKSVKGILENRHEYMMAQNVGNVPGIMKTWTQSKPILMPPGAPSVEGYDAITQWYAITQSQVIIEFVIQYQEFVFNADYTWGFARATYQGTVTTRADAFTALDSGKILETHVKGPDGKWLFQSHMWSSDLPPTAGGSAQ